MVANLVSKRDAKIARNLRISWENWDFPSPKLQFSSHKIQFFSMAFQFLRNPRKSSSTAYLVSSTAFRFLQRLSNFQEIRENLLQRLSNFFNGFPLSSTAFC
jgi:hypothetical protein